MPTQDEREQRKDERAADKQADELKRAEAKAARRAENERRKAAGQPELPEDPNDQPHPDQTLPGDLPKA